MADPLDLMLTVNPVVISKRMEGGAVLVDSLTGACFELNRMAADIWNELEQGASPASVAELLATRHAISVERARADVRALLNDLLRQGLLNPHE